MIGYFRRIVVLLSVNPGLKISELEIITEEEKTRVLEMSNGVEEESYAAQTIHRSFEDQVEKSPNSIALVGISHQAQSTTQRLVLYSAISFKELNEKSNRLASVLIERGVTTDTIVGLMVERSVEMIAAILAILKAGGAYLPIDKEYPEKRKRFMLKDSRIKLLLTYHDSEPLPGAPTGEIEILDISDEGIYSRYNSNSKPMSIGTNLLYVIYTSGTTGKPKGVMLEHKNLVNLVSHQYQYTNIDFSRVLQFTTISFDVSAQEIFSTLLAGGQLSIIDKETRNNVTDLFKIVERDEIKTLFLATAFLKFIFKEKDYVGLIPASVKHIVAAGEQLIIGDNLKKYLKANQVYLHNHYGPSETHVVTALTLEPPEEIPDIPSIGKPILNTSIFILDKKQCLLPIGVSGEMYISGIQVGRGYLDRPQLTAERFNRIVIRHSSVVDSSSKFSPNEQCPMPNDRLYKTGDLVRWLPDGNIEFLGRMDDQVKIRGFRVELGEVESQLLTHDEITEAVVVLREEKQGYPPYLCGYFVSNRNISSPELREYLLKTLPDYMIPTYFVQVDKIPITPNGKIDRKTLPAPELKAGENYVAPGNKVEKKLVEIWSEVLGIEKEKISMNDNFFHLGGHSLKATILISKLHRSLNIKLPLTEFFKRPTIEEISHYIKHIKGAARNKYTGLDIIEEREYYELSSAQKRLFILDQTEGAINTAYNLPVAMLIEGEFIRQRVEDSFNTLVTRHDSFRTSFDIKGGKPVQIIHDTVVFKIKYSTLENGHPGNKSLDPEKANELNQIVKDFIKPFELGKAPLLKASLTCLGSKKHLLLFDMHHIISDGFSTGVLVKEFLHLYEGKALPQLKLQYKDFTGWQNKLLNSEEMKKQEDYWLNRFRGDIPILNMPTDYPRQPVKNFEGNTVSWEIDRELTGKISEVMEETGTTLYMILLAIFNILLSKYTGQEDIIVGVPAAARSHPDLENIIGMFVNTLAMRNYPGKERSFDDFLQEVKENALKAFENQDYPFEELVNKLEISKDYSRNPLFDVLFVSEKLEIPGLELRGLTFTPFEIENKISHMDLVLYIVEENDTIVLRLEYDSDLFKGSSAEEMLKHYVDILEQAVKYRSIQLEEIDISQDLLVAQANIVKENLEDFGF
jgi:amino acid adenylation domain-containing protein